MLKIVGVDRKYALLEQIVPAIVNQVSLHWYNSFYQRFINVRTAYITWDKSREELEALLKDERLRIFTVLDHEPLITEMDEVRIRSGEVTRTHLTERQRIKDSDGDWYIDEFGLYVYTQSYIGYDSDTDRRYSFTKFKDTELFTLTHYEP